ncbi:MAG: ABC transporter substrate-binding protein, partial [Planctomycetes bacterium]|nr:ABC transporter substrate-binding protein [Planctomycetota bacterium]
QYSEAHEASREMLKIWPDVEGGRDLVLELARQYPLIVVSVSQPALTLAPASLEDFAARRSGHLVYPTLIEYQERGPDGGRYASPFGSVQQSDDRMQLIFDLRSGQSGVEFTGYDLSRNLLAITDPASPRYDPSWSSLMAALQVEDVMRVRVDLRRPHVLPQGMLRTTFQLGNEIASRYAVERISETETRYKPAGEMNDAAQPRPVIVERFNAEPRAAIEDLRKGKIDMIDRLLPADAIRLRQEPGIQIGTYSFPTMFVLATNSANPYLANRTFRRALVYGINREVILNKGLLNGNSVDGSRLISAPLPAGITPNDPSAYAYDERIEPYPYDPVMAAILVGLATQQLGSIADQRQEPAPELGTLVLAHPFGELYRFIARQIQAQLEVFELACELRELPPGETRVADGKFDLQLMEIRMLEPLIDLPRLLGEGGVLPTDDPYVNLGLRKLDESQNWKEARDNLQELHRMLHNDVTLIPLWQMVEYFAYHDGLRGVRDRPIYFYQDVDTWRVVPPEQSD